MIERFRSRFSVAGLSPSDGARSAAEVRKEFADRAWNRNPVVEWDHARRLLTVEFEFDIAETESREPVVLVQYRELSDCLRRCRSLRPPISIEILDSWLVRRSEDPVQRAA